MTAWRKPECLKFLTDGELRWLEQSGTLRVRSGRLWLTSEGEAEDWLLDRDEEFDLSGHRRVLIQALEETVLEMAEPNSRVQ